MRSHRIDPLSPVSPSTPSRTNALSAADALEVAARLLAEGLKNLDAAPESALVACGQALGLEVAHGDDDARLARACAAVCRALSRLQRAEEATAPLVAALDALDARRAAGAAVDDECEQFLAWELLCLARRLAGTGAAADGGAGGGEASPPRPPTLESLRAADRGFERLAAFARRRRLRLGGAVAAAVQEQLHVSSQELLFQQAAALRATAALLVRRGGVGGGATPRDADAAAFHLHRAARKLALAGLPEGHAERAALRADIKALGDAADAARGGVATPSKAQAAAGAEDGGGECTVS